MSNREALANMVAVEKAIDSSGLSFPVPVREVMGSWFARLGSGVVSLEKLTALNKALAPRFKLTNIVAVKGEEDERIIRLEIVFNG